MKAASDPAPVDVLVGEEEQQDGRRVSPFTSQDSKTSADALEGGLRAVPSSGDRRGVLEREVSRGEAVETDQVSGKTVDRPV